MTFFQGEAIHSLEVPPDNIDAAESTEICAKQEFRSIKKNNIVINLIELNSINLLLLRSGYV